MTVALRRQRAGSPSRDAAVPPWIGRVSPERRPGCRRGVQKDVRPDGEPEGLGCRRLDVADRWAPAPLPAGPRTARPAAAGDQRATRSPGLKPTAAIGGIAADDRSRHLQARQVGYARQDGGSVAPARTVRRFTHLGRARMSSSPRRPTRDRARSLLLLLHSAHGGRTIAIGRSARWPAPISPRCAHRSAAAFAARARSKAAHLRMPFRTSIRAFIDSLTPLLVGFPGPDLDDLAFRPGSR